MNEKTEDSLFDYEIGIIGAGFAGVAMAIQLKRMGIESFVLFESAERVGGTWRENTYPGCACDVPSPLYSYSFEPNPNWSHLFGHQKEILAYIEHCVEKYEISSHLRFSTRIEELRFEERTGAWHIRAKTGESWCTRVVVSGTGPLTKPAYPDISGQEDFKGVSFHSACWDHSYPLEGKTVAVVGTGASAIQFVPEIAPKVEKLYLFQRTPAWIVPRDNRAFDQKDKERFAHYPILLRLLRDWIYCQLEYRAIAFVKFPWLLRLAAWIARKHIEDSISDPTLREMVTPDYHIGCKRILLSNNYYPALERDNVEVIPSGLASIGKNSVSSEDGRIWENIDAIIYGTGFHVNDFLSPMKVFGLEGKELGKCWKDGSETYLGLTVADFPNFYMLVGPNTGLGHNSIVFMIEAQVHYIMQCIQLILDQNLRYLDVKKSPQRRFNEQVQKRLKKTVWMTGCRSWYQTKDGRIFTLWPGFTAEYWLRTRRMNRSHFRLVR